MNERRIFDGIPEIKKGLQPPPKGTLARIGEGVIVKRGVDIGEAACLGFCIPEKEESGKENHETVENPVSPERVRWVNMMNA